MKRLLYFLLLTICLVGCTDDRFDAPTSIPEGQPVELRLSFASKGSIQTVISRQTMPNLSDEAKIWNLYVFVFDSDGNKIYGHYFDSNNLKNENGELPADTWHVSVPTGDSETCEGTINIKTISKTGCSIYTIANMDSVMVNFSPETFSLIRNEDELKSQVVSLNQQLIERSGFFPMTGVLQNVNTGNITIINKLKLTRLDAKVRFWVTTGNDSGIETFELKNWQVFNVPASSYFLPRDNRTDSNDAPGTYFNSDTKNVEDMKSSGDGNNHYGFSFYMLENNMLPKKTPQSYCDRERQTKNADGLNGDWEFANSKSTYVVITGRVVMKTDSPTSQEGATLNANVRYVIHLGDFNNNQWDNFATERNTFYTYYVTINGVNDIRVEVQTSNDDSEGVTENSPGATGEVTIALQEIIDCDAHYYTHVMEFDAKNIKADNVTWYVRTPFGEGKPYNNNGVDITTGLDFKWIEFRVNKKDNNIFSDKRQRYIPHHTKKDKNGMPYASSDGETMYVDELVAYLKKQKAAYDVNPANSDFDINGKLKVTAFINEFYYEEHPISGEKSNELWKQFVNRDEMRLMHILSDTKESLDKESSEVGSSFTIQQRSIQTVYNHNHPDLTTAWGVEHFDEHAGIPYNQAGHGVHADRGNSDDYNGRLNSMIELGLANSTDKTFITGKKWSDFLNVEAIDENDELPSKYNYLQYSCLTRNRDNNGNGIIDADEIRWYMPAIKQLVGLWMGADGIQNTARMYTRTAKQRASNDFKEWRQHIVSSTQTDTNSNNPTIIWAEEGCSIGSIKDSEQYGNSAQQWTGLKEWETVCVRNLGMDNETDLTKVPTDYVKISGSDIAPTFDLTYLNAKCIRYRAQDGIDLVYSDEKSVQNKLYWKFEATSVDCPTFAEISFDQMQEEINKSLSNNRFCPKGYRLPNQRELILMHMYCNWKFWNGITQSFSRTYYSFGAYGNNTKESEKKKCGWSRGWGKVFMAEKDTEKSSQIRAVRDLAP